MIFVAKIIHPGLSSFPPLSITQLKNQDYAYKITQQEDK
jgi:hypothetical protein